MRQKFIRKCDRSLIENASGFSVQNATVLLHMRQLLQNATLITNCDSTTTYLKNYQKTYYNDN